MQESLILGIDPGSRNTGWGLVTYHENKWQSVAAGAWSLEGSTFIQRLHVLQESLGELLLTFKPNQVAIENVFLSKNAQSALKLGQARGIILGCVLQSKLPIFEYAPRQIKQAIVGKGGATKEQVQQMVKWLLKLDDTLTFDASDALAIALTHAHVQSSGLLFQQTAFVRRKTSKRSTRWKSYDRKA